MAGAGESKMADSAGDLLTRSRFPAPDPLPALCAFYRTENSSISQVVGGAFHTQRCVLTSVPTSSDLTRAGKQVAWMSSGQSLCGAILVQLGTPCLSQRVYSWECSDPSNAMGLLKII